MKYTVTAKDLHNKRLAGELENYLNSIPTDEYLKGIENIKEYQELKNLLIYGTAVPSEELKNII